MKKLRGFQKKLALLGITSLICALPAVAGTPDNPSVNINYNQSTVINNTVTQIANDVILQHLWEIIGKAKLQDNSHGGQVSTWETERVVSDAEFASAVASVKTDLETWLGNFPGRTAAFYENEGQTGERLDFVSQSYEEHQTGQTTDVTTTLDTHGAQEGSDYLSGDTQDPTQWIAINDVNVDVNEVTTITNFIDAITTTSYNQVAVWQISAYRLISPLLLDLDGDGAIQASGGEWLPHSKTHKDRMAFFDFHGDKFPVLMEWPGPKDGILCHPKADGTIDGTRLFGTAGGFSNGYEALRVRDANNDGKISGQELEGLAVWTDLNSDARPQAGEVKNVGELGITELSLNHKKYVASYQRDGKSYRMFDWWPQTFELNRIRIAPQKA